MDSLFNDYNLNRFEIKKPRKDSERQSYVSYLSELTGRTKKSIYFSFVGLPDTWLKDAIDHCKSFSDIKARNFKLKEFITNSKNI